MRLVSRPCLLALLLLALLLPRVGAALAEVGPGLNWVVICRGDALVAIAVGPDGAPVEVEVAEAAPCLAAAPPPEDAAPGGWRRLAREVPGPTALAPPPPRGPDPGLAPHPNRGPPSPV